jgi:hypothetical protein
VKRSIALSTATVLAVGGLGTAFAAAGGGGHDNARAVAEAKALLATAPTLNNAVRASAAPVKLLKQAPQRPEYNQLVERRAFWTVDETWRRAYAALTATTPTGLTPEGNGRIRGPKLSDDELYAAFGPRQLPAGIAYGALLIAVTPDGHDKSAIGVYAQAVPQPPRPKTEIVPLSLKRAHVGARTLAGHIVRANTVTGAAATRLVRDFDALVVDPLGVMSCPVDRGRREMVTFRANGHKIVATTGFCDMVSVTRDGRRLPALESSTRFTADIRRDLAPSAARNNRPKRPASEHVPRSLHRAQLTLRKEPFGKVMKRLTVDGKQATRLVRAFDAMKTLPRNAIRCMIAGGPQDVVTFRTAAHTWRVKESACTDVVVTHDGKRLPTLIPSAAWEKAIKHDLGA